jgi:zinc protease
MVRHPKAVFIVSLLTMLIGQVFVYGAGNPGLDQLHLKTGKTILDNGMTVLISEIPSSTVVSIYLLVKSGSSTEGRFLGAGLTHFHEHLLFKGTETRGVGEIADEVQAMGGIINATTGLDYTFFTMTVPADVFPKALEILADMLMRPRFDKQELEKEREVIYNEMRLLRDNPQRHLSELIFTLVYMEHPYRVPVIGYENLLAGVTYEDFLEFHNKFYVPNNMVLSIAGKIDQSSAVADQSTSTR